VSLLLVLRSRLSVISSLWRVKREFLIVLKILCHSVVGLPHDLNALLLLFILLLKERDLIVEVVILVLEYLYIVF
jgi:hypothetical protein